MLAQQSETAHKLLHRGKECIFPAFFPPDCVGHQGMTTSNAAESAAYMLLRARKEATLLGSLLSTHHTLCASLDLKRKMLAADNATFGPGHPLVTWARQKVVALGARVTEEGWRTSPLDLREVREATLHWPAQVELDVLVRPADVFVPRPGHNALGASGSTGQFAHSDGFRVTLRFLKPTNPATKITYGMDMVHLFHMHCDCGRIPYTRTICVHAMAGIAASKQGTHWQLFVISERPWLAHAALRAATVPSADDVEAGLGGRVEWQKIDEAHAGVRAPNHGTPCAGGWADM
jgi:hypothetical protein